MRPLVLVLLFCEVARADGGILRVSQSTGPFVVSVFTAPEPLRVGRADVSVLVLKSGEVMLGANVELHLRGPDGAEQTLPASHALATNRLLQSALVDLPSPGRWQLEIEVDHQATVACELPVAPRSQRIAEHWMPLALPPLCVLLVALRARLSARLRRSRT